MKKLFVSVLSMLFVLSCKSDPSLQFDNKGTVNALSKSKEDLKAVFKNAKIPSKLPDLPTQPIFPVFNNAYRALAEENESIARQDPYNSDKYFFKVIQSAKVSLDAAFFDIDEPATVQALVQAKKAGVNVRVVTDTDNIKDKENPELPRPSLEFLRDAGIPIVDDRRSAFMHHKFMIIDGNAVWMGSTNPTGKSMYQHNNNSIYLQSPQLAQTYSTEFNKMFDKHDFGDIVSKSSNQVINVKGDTVQVFFSPLGGTKAAIIEEIKKAKKSIKFMAFAYTDNDIGNAMIEKKKEGLTVEGVYDSCLVGQYSTYDDLLQNSVKVYRDGNQALLHHKTIIIDDHILINGSFNFSKNAEVNNNEDDLIINSYKVAKYFLDEYQRVKTAALTHHNIPPYDHPACGYHPTPEPNEPPAKNSLDYNQQDPRD